MSDSHSTKLSQVVLGFTLLLTSSCQGVSMQQLYKSDQIKRLEVISGAADSVEIRYSPLLETLYFSPGANVVETTDAVTINFVRCPIKRTCDVTHQARQDPDGSSVIVVNHQGKPIFINYADGKQQVYPK